MKKYLRTITPLILAVLLISACAPQTAAPVQTEAPAPALETAPAEETEPVEEPAEAEAAEAEVVETEAAETETVNEEEPFPYTDAEMEALIAEKADGNHSLSFILNQNKTREEWEETLNRMIGYGAQISPEEKELIIDWLLWLQGD